MTSDEILAALEQDEAGVRALRVLHMALLLGPTIFAGVTALLASQTQVSPERAAKAVAELRIFSMVNGALAPVCFAVAIFIFRSRIRAAVRGEADGAPIAALRGAWIIAMALMEGAALFGLATCFLAATQGALRVEPLLALNALPWLAFLAQGLIWFPTGNTLAKILTRAAV